MTVDSWLGQVKEYDHLGIVFHRDETVGKEISNSVRKSKSIHYTINNTLIGNKTTHV